MLGIWDTLLVGKADATWVFMGWEGIIAQQKGVPLNAFMLSDSKVRSLHTAQHVLQSIPCDISGTPAA